MALSFLLWVIRLYCRVQRWTKSIKYNFVIPIVCFILTYNAVVSPYYHLNRTPSAVCCEYALEDQSINTHYETGKRQYFKLNQ